MKCSTCSNENAPDSDYCDRCGNPLEGQGDAGSAAAPASAGAVVSLRGTLLLFILGISIREFWDWVRIGTHLSRSAWNGVSWGLFGLFAALTFPCVCYAFYSAVLLWTSERAPVDTALRYISVYLAYNVAYTLAICAAGHWPHLVGSGLRAFNLAETGGPALLLLERRVGFGSAMAALFSIGFIKYSKAFAGVLASSTPPAQ
jgi:hypothetical protein